MSQATQWRLKMRWVASPSVLKGVKVKSKSNLSDLSYALFLDFSFHHVSLLFTIVYGVKVLGQLAKVESKNLQRLIKQSLCAH